MVPRAIALISLCLASIGCAPMTFVVGVSPGNQHLTQTVVRSSGRWLAPRVAIVDLTGMIHNASKPHLWSRGENPVSLIAEKLEKARRDDRIKAIILRLNTPGGTVTATDAVHRLIGQFKHRCGKPVIALMMDIAASGGYYVACAADRIIAYPTAITGSIGVMVQTISFKPALERFGVQNETITTGPNKTVGSPLSVMTDEHRAVLQAMVDDFYGRFVDVVRRSRPMIAPDRFAHVTDGRVVSGQAAVLLGLVDETGDLEEAFDRAKQLSDIDHADLVLYHRPLTYMGSPYATASTGGGSGTQINLAPFNLSDTLVGPDPGFYYLWQP